MNQVQKQILKILKEFDDENPGYYMARNYLPDKLKIDDKTLEKNVMALKQEKYVNIASAIGVKFNSAKITGKGIDLVKSNFGVSVFPENWAVASGSGSMEYRFNEICNSVNLLNSKNKGEIVQKINIIQEELKKDEISTSKIHDSIEWLKENARWTVLPLAQIILTACGVDL